MFDVMTIGESMIVFAPTENTTIRYAHTMGKRIAGAESNTAIGLAKLGKKVSWFSRIGNDSFGEYIMHELGGYGVDTSTVIVCDDLPTGIMFKEPTIDQETNVYYYRKGSAASVISKSDLPFEQIKQTKILHITGITPALSSSCKEAIFELIHFAKKNHVKICFDPNVRLKLWSEEEMRETLLKILALSDIVLLGDDEAHLLLETKESELIISKLKDIGVSKIAIKLGDKGAVVSDGNETYQIAPVPAVVVDSIGAGDAFNAGFLYGILENKSIKESGEIAAIMGACVVSTMGDVEGLPSIKQLDAILNKEAKIYR